MVHVKNFKTCLPVSNDGYSIITTETLKYKTLKKALHNIEQGWTEPHSYKCKEYFPFRDELTGWNYLEGHRSCHTRRGTASFNLSCDLPAELIKTDGVWKSQAFQAYLAVPVTSTGTWSLLLPNAYKSCQSL